MLHKSIQHGINECSSTDLQLPVIDISASVKLSTGLNRMDLYENNTATQKANIGIVKQIYVDLYFQTLTAYQTLPIVKVAFLDDNSAFVSHILLCFDKRLSNFNRV